MLQIADLNTEWPEFKLELERVKGEIDASFPWYPWGTLQNIAHLDTLLTGSARNLRNLVGELPVADVGAADGELSFFLERHGIICDVVDYAPTNMNGLRGAGLLKDRLKSKVDIFEINLDEGFRWPRPRYGLIFFLGILYHLKNPFLVLEAMARASNYALVSTKIARYVPDGSVAIDNLPLAYLLHASEANNDPTNFWVFSDAGLKRLFDRCGWDLVDYMRVGNTTHSDPASAGGDERAFALIKSRYF